MAEEPEETEEPDPAAPVKQKVVRLPPEETPGPHFPSGMSSEEAAMAGATANLSDEEAAKMQEKAAQYGITPPSGTTSEEEE